MYTFWLEILKLQKLKENIRLEERFNLMQIIILYNVLYNLVYKDNNLEKKTLPNFYYQ